LPGVIEAMRTFDLLGTPLLATTYEALIAHAQQLAGSGGPHAIDFTNTHIVTLRRHDPEFREITSRFDHFVPDGMPLIWCLNARGAKLRDRVYGPTFMRRAIEASPAPWTHYLLGGSAECVAALQRRFENAKIVAVHHGYFVPNEEQDILAEINRLAPDFIWIGLGTPKQQDWIHRNKSAINRGVILAVGFAFDVNAGLKRDAPDWMQRLGLTWLFRAASEPGRLLNRYLRYNILFLYYLAKDGLFAHRS
jgi:N-acetylglucosaminyldiphosphoundecaprenol N-acetyl-beta-D-mannosaminyltransferase